MTKRLLVLSVAVCLVLGGTAVLAQQKTAKQAESLAKAGDQAKKAINDVVAHLGGMLQGAQKSADAVGKEADKYFASWEKDLADFSSDDLKQKSQARLDKSKADYAALGDALGQAQKAFEPLMQNLNDQIPYLGRDLSPEAVADLKGEAEAEPAAGE